MTGLIPARKRGRPRRTQADGAQPGWEHRQGESKPRIRIIGL